MKKKIITLSAIAAFATTSFAATDVENRLSEMEKKISKLEKKLKKSNKKLNEVKAHDASDNIKWDVDFRTAVDSIHYEHASGKKSSNSDLLTNRLWLGMGFAPSDNVLFKGKLSYNKVYGQTVNKPENNFSTFDWVTNENANDNTIKVKEAYWLYKNDTFFDTDVPWTLSVGRRPSTDGLGINMREGMKDNSPLSHTVNVEFDGLSSRFNLDKLTGIEGMWWKLCTGRGLTNATPRFDNDTAYAEDTTQTEDMDMYGFIFVPWDNGQYSVHTNYAKAVNMIGFTDNDLSDGKISDNSFSNFGNLELLTAMFKAEGLGDEISDYLDDTIFFASWAQSKTDPKNNMNMLGSNESQTGNSYWVGLNLPCLFSDDGRIGIEWNKGSKYWRSMTYGEDTMAGSKIAARGTAWEVYYDKPLTESLKLNLRYTHIKYDYTGSNAFFGADGRPMTMAEAQEVGQDPVEKATDLRLSVSYRF
ncbi:MAG: DUF3373 family protein [Arcobacteraceae bacterium]